MLNTRMCQVLGIRHPVALGGMGTGTSPELVAAVSAAGGLGVQGASSRPPGEIARLAEAIRGLSDRPFGMNLLLFLRDEAAIAAVLAARPAVFSTAWAFPDQDLRTLFARAHDAGGQVMHMISTVHEARRAAEAGADLIVAQGTEGGGHVGMQGTMVLVPQAVRAVAPVPVLAAGGVADGAGLAASLALGAEGVLLGTRFLATHESPLPQGLKEAIVASDGHDTELTEIPDLISGQVWPGAYGRVLRNRLIEEFLGRHGELRRNRAAVAKRVQDARAQGDPGYSVLYVGQTAGLIDGLELAAGLVERIVRDAEAILRERLPGMLGGA